MIKRLIKRNEVPNRQWFPFMNKINDAILGKAFVAIVREDVQFGEWHPQFEKINEWINNPTATNLEPLRREDFEIWYPCYDVINQSCFGVYSIVNSGVNGLTVNFVVDKDSYEKYVPANYREKYTYEESEPSLPWLVVNFDRNDNFIEPVLNIEANGTECEFKNVPANLGTVTEDGLALADLSYIMFEMKNDLGIEAENPVVKVTVSQKEYETSVEVQRVTSSGVTNVKAHLVTDEASYNEYVPAEYREKYTYEESAPSFPWAVLTYKTEDGAEPTLKVKKGDTAVTFVADKIPASVGTVENGNIKLAAKDNVMFELKNDLGVEDSAKLTFTFFQYDFETSVVIDYTKE